MVYPDVVRNIFGVVGNVISLGFFLMPVPTFLKMIKKKSVGECRPEPHLATLLLCALWSLYAHPSVRPDSTLVLTINGAGVLIEAVYVAVFFVLAPGKERRRMLAVLGAEASFMVALALGVLLGARTHDVRSFIVGIFCLTPSSFMYAAPLTVIIKVVETKSVDDMAPFFLLMLGFLNAMCWTAYAVIKLDSYLFLLNGLGVLFSLAQLILYFCYCDESTPKKEKNVELPTVRPKPNNAMNGSNINITMEQIPLLDDGDESFFSLMD